MLDYRGVGLERDHCDNTHDIMLANLDGVRNENGPPRTDMVPSVLLQTSGPI